MRVSRRESEMNIFVPEQKKREREIGEKKMGKKRPNNLSVGSYDKNYREIRGWRVGTVGRASRRVASRPTVTEISNPACN